MNSQKNNINFSMSKYTFIYKKQNRKTNSYNKNRIELLMIQTRWNQVYLVSLNLSILQFFLCLF